MIGKTINVSLLIQRNVHPFQINRVVNISNAFGKPINVEKKNVQISLHQVHARKLRLNFQKDMTSVNGMRNLRLVGL